MASEATERPWAKETEGQALHLVDGSQQPIATMWAADAQAQIDLDLIVLAVNAHDAMLAALEGILNYVDTGGGAKAERAEADCLTAIALAKGENDEPT